MADDEVRTQAEIDASVAKTLAEAEKAMAEAEQARYEAEKLKYEAGKARIHFEEQEGDRKAELASDEYNHVYRFDTDVNANSVKKCMMKLTEWHRLDPTCDIEIIFSSPGGSIINGMALFDFLLDLRAKGHKLTTGAAGMAASMAGILLQAGDVRWVGKQSWVLIHRASFGIMGSTYQVEDELEFIKRIEKRIIDIFTKRSNLSSSTIKRKWERKDFWIDADECLKWGIVDEIRGEVDAS